MIDPVILCHRGDIIVELDGDREFLCEIIRRIEATMFGTTLRTRHGSVPLTKGEKDRLDRIAQTEGLTPEQLIERRTEKRTLS